MTPEDNKTTVQFDNATKKQLILLATEQLGLEVNANAKVETLRSQIRESGFDAAEFTLEEELEPINAPTQAQVAEMDDERTVEILIPMQEGVVAGTEPVVVGVNGVVARIMRGVPVKVPVKYVRVLDNARKTMMVLDDNSQIIGTREAHLYPFTVVQAF